MWRLAVAWTFVVACGRVGFDPVASGGDDTSSGDGGMQGSQSTMSDGGATGEDADSGSSPIEDCTYMMCPGNQEACCAAGNTTCEPVGSCAGIVVPCDLTNHDGCPMAQMCCASTSTIFCTPALCMI
ncbi:MAG TPA: hypothetical protein VIV11_30225 [Kofleriaceae bacterium]